MLNSVCALLVWCERATIKTWVHVIFCLVSGVGNRQRAL